MGEGGVWGPYNEGKSWKEKNVSKRKRGKKIIS
jgi:hypothetical protein